MRRLVRSFVACAILAAAASPGCAGPPASKAGLFDARREVITLPRHRDLNVTLVKPVTPRNPLLLVVFATGDAGWFGASGSVLEHMADEGFYVAAFDSREIVAHIKRAGGLADIPEAAAGVDSMIVQSRRALGLPDATPVVISGFSRGASLVVLTAGVRSLQQHLAGGLAIALTRETDYLKAPDPALRPPALHVDEKGRMQTYPAIALAGSIPFAVIQAKGDKYVPAEEARQLFGPDSPTRRLYEVDASSHGFGGGKDELLKDVDDALGWIEGTARHD